MRKIISIAVLSLFLSLSLSAPAAAGSGAPPAGASWLGDVNDDGSLNVFDLLALLKIISGAQAPTERQRALANTDKSADSAIGVFDLLALLKLLSGSAQPEAIYWGPPSLAEVTPAHVLPGDTVTLTFQNVRGSVPMRLYLRGVEVEFLDVQPAAAVFVTPDSFPGGFLHVVSGADTLGIRFLNIRNADVHTIAGCRIFPADNPWNQPIDAFPVHKDSDMLISGMEKFANLHPDMSSDSLAGMPYTTVDSNQPFVPLSSFYSYESDPGPAPIPDNTPIEGGPDATGDRHTLVIDSTRCILYEVFSIYRDGPGWRSGGLSIWDLNSNAQRPDGWTSADAAGLSILAGVVQYDEVAAGAVNHAIRFTVDVTRRAYIYPATHFASSRTEPNLPPMGLRVRIRADYSLSQFTGQALVIAKALKKFGMILADNGGQWMITGGRSRKWKNNELEQLKSIHGYNFEVVDCESMVVSGRGSRYNIRPASNVTFPPYDTTFAAGEDIPVRVEAYDNDGSVARVEFFADNVRLGEATAAPYDFVWRGASSGSHVISARSTDNGGMSNTSWGVKITVAR